MRHIKSFRTLNRTHSHRKALYRNMVEALFKNERIKTTKIKAKEIRRIAEKLITKAKNKTLHNIRIVGRLIKDKEILMKLFNEIGPRFADRNGGYTRIIKLAKRRGDDADMAYLELLGDGAEVSQKKKKKKKIEVPEETKETKEEDKKVETKKEEGKKSPDTKKNSSTTKKVEVKKDTKKKETKKAKPAAKKTEKKPEKKAEKKDKKK